MKPNIRINRRIFELAALPSITERVTRPAKVSILDAACGFGEAVAKSGHYKTIAQAAAAGWLNAFGVGHDYAIKYGALAPVEFPKEAAR